MNSRYTLIILLSLSCLLSCSKQENTIVPYLNNKDFFKSLSGERILADYPFVYPQALLTTEKYLIVNDRNDSSLLISFPFMHTGEDPKFIGKAGIGPDEFMSIRTLTLQRDSTLFIYDPILQRVKWFKLLDSEPTLDRDNLMEEFSLATQNIRGDLFPVKNGLVVSMVNGDRMFRRILDNKEPLDFGEYPGSTEGIEDPVKFEMQHQFILASNYSGDRFVCAGINNDWLAFFNMNGQPKLLKEYFSDETVPPVEMETNGNETIWSKKEASDIKVYFMDLLPSKEFLFATFKGMSKGKNESDKPHPTYVLKFDWDGNFLKGYTLNKPSGSKTVTPDGKYLIAVVESGNELILEKFKLD